MSSALLRTFERVACDVRADLDGFCRTIGRRTVAEFTEAERSRWAELLTTRGLVETLHAQHHAGRSGEEVRHD